MKIETAIKEREVAVETKKRLSKMTADRASFMSVLKEQRSKKLEVRSICSITYCTDVHDEKTITILTVYTVYTCICIYMCMYTPVHRQYVREVESLIEEPFNLWELSKVQFHRD